MTVKAEVFLYIVDLPFTGSKEPSKNLYQNECPWFALIALTWPPESLKLIPTEHLWNKLYS